MEQIQYIRQIIAHTIPTFESKEGIGEDDEYDYEEWDMNNEMQEQYRNGEIKEEQLTHIQIKSLCDLYDKQIEELQKSNEFRKQRILQYRKKL